MKPDRVNTSVILILIIVCSLKSSQTPKTDILVFTDGNISIGTIKEITDSNISYFDHETQHEQNIPLKFLERVIDGDSKQILIHDGQRVNEEMIFISDIEYQSYFSEITSPKQTPARQFSPREQQKKPKSKNVESKPTPIEDSDAKSPDQIQSPPEQDQFYTKPFMKLSGPRTGITVITGKLADTIKDEYELVPTITQFGWQYETMFFSIPDGPVGVSEYVILVGGIEQGVAIPSLSWVVGLRGPTGLEIGVGPNISLSGIAYVIAGGITKSYGQLNVPINGSIVLSQGGIRFSVLVGFTSAVYDNKQKERSRGWLW